MRALLILVALFCLPTPSSAHTGPLIVILLPGTGLRDWRSADAPCLHRLLATGALAMMNTRTARLPNDRNRETQESSTLTLGAGSRAASVSGVGIFRKPNTPLPGLDLTVGEAYARRMGVHPRPGTDVDPAWPGLLKANQGRGYDIRIGNLADTLENTGIPVKAGGGPLSALVAADNRGEVVPVPSLRRAADECLVWDAGGDIHAADGVLQQASAVTRATAGMLIVLSPCASDADYAQGRRLTPILEWGTNVPAGLLKSPSTRRSGLVTDTDFAPTIAAYFGVSKFVTLPFGRPWTASPAPRAVQRASALEEQSYQQAHGMRLLPYLAVLLALWVGIGTALAVKGRMPTFWPLVPPALILAVLVSMGAGAAAVLMPLCVLAAVFTLRLLGISPSLLAFLAAIAAVLTVDMTTGGWLMQRSLMGYSAVEGARYYGVGNEAMGPLVAALLILTARAWHRSRLIRVLLVLLLGTVALLLGSPLAGAKAGGLLVSLLAFSTLLFSLSEKSWSPRVAAAMTLSVILLMTALAAGDAIRPGQAHSHVGEALQRAMSGGVGELGDVITRKLAVESRLAYHSAWALPLWGGLACLWAAWHLNESTGKEERALRVSGLVAVVSCLLLNDAGVVAAALCIVVLWCGEACRAAKKKPPEAFSLPGAVG